jgi:precorrin-3B synthase
MPTGDGWLVRFAPAAGLTGAQAAGLADAAGRLGNGRIEVTSRGSLQVRVLTPATARALARVLDELGIEVLAGPVLTGALAGLDAAERDDPRAVAAAIRRRAAGMVLAPKASVVVDGGGALHLDGVGADVRVRALGTGVWEVVGAGRFDADGAVTAALAALARPGPRERGREAAVPVGRFALRDGVAVGVGAAFGQVEATALADLAAAVGAGELRPAPGRGLIAVGVDAETFLVAAEASGFVVDPADPRLAIVACSGAPACASAHLATRELAVELARRPELLAGVRVHLSGCGKRCAQPAGNCVTLVAGEAGDELLGEGMAVPAGLAAFLARVREAGQRPTRVATDHRPLPFSGGGA